MSFTNGFQQEKLPIETAFLLILKYNYCFTTFIVLTPLLVVTPTI